MNHTELYRQDAVLRDGTSVTVRSIQPADARDLMDLFASLHDPSVYARYFAPSGGSGAASRHGVDAVCRPEAAGGLALVVTADDHERQRVVGIGRCERDAARPTTASLTLAVHQAWQNRGIGTLLLEHLAGLAQHSGISTFEGFALSDDRHILEVLRKSGLRATRSVQAGRVHIELSTEETPRLRHLSVHREMRATARSLEPFFAPGAIAVIGASRREGSIGRSMIANLAAVGFPGKLYPVNPTAEEILGLRTYPSVEAIPGPVDLAFVVVPAPIVEQTVRQCLRKGIRGVVIISSGFAEVGPEGREAEERIRDMVRGAGTRLLGPNCMGLIVADPKRPLYGTFSGQYPPPGNIAMVSQSGGLGIAILDYVTTHGLGISSFVSIGNRADVSVNDLLSYWSSDDRTSVIALYLESFGNPEKFARMAPLVARRKPIVAVKSGRTAAGSRAASSHSASLASVDVAVDALFEQAGVIRTNTMEELFDVAKVLATQPLPAGRRVGVVSNSGGPGVLLADALEGRDFRLPALSETTMAALREMLPHQAGFANPIDTLAYADGDLYAKAVELLGSDENVDSVVAVYVPPLVTNPQDVAAGIARGAGRVPAHKPVLTVFLATGEHVPEDLHTGPRGRLPAFAFPENAAQALWSVERYARWRDRPRGAPYRPTAAVRQHIRAIIDQTLAENSAAQWLEPARVGALLEAVGVSLARSRVATTETVECAAAEIGYPVVLKALSPDLLHKSDAGGVVLGIEGVDDLRAAVRSMSRRMRQQQLRVDAYLVQQQIERGVEFLVGATLDPVFGHLIVTGAGGVFAEVLKDVSFSLSPVRHADAAEMLDKLKASALLTGFRGGETADRKALEDTILRVSALVEVAPEIVELDLNPVKVLPAGQGTVIVDARVRVEAR